MIQNWVPFTNEIEVVFANYIPEREKTLSMNIFRYYNHISNLIEWCKTDCKSRFAFVAHYPSKDYRFIFEDEQDACCFKLMAL